MHRIFFPQIRHIYASKSHRFLAKSVQFNKAFQAVYAAGRLGHVLQFLYSTRHDWKKKKLGKEVLSFSRFREQGMLIFLLNLILFILPNRK